MLHPFPTSFCVALAASLFMPISLIADNITCLWQKVKEKRTSVTLVEIPKKTKRINRPKERTAKFIAVDKSDDTTEAISSFARVRWQRSYFLLFLCCNGERSRSKVIITFSAETQIDYDPVLRRRCNQLSP